MADYFRAYCVSWLGIRRLDADAWFDRRGAERYQMLEHTFPLPNDEILTLLTFTDAEMMEEKDNAGSYRRKH